MDKSPNHDTQALLIKKTITMNPTQSKNEVKVEVNKMGVSSTTFLAMAIWKSIEAV